MTQRSHSALLPLSFPPSAEGVYYLVDHRDAALTGGAVAAALVLPGPRRFLWRRTLGRLRSQEAVFRSAELQAAVLGEKLEGQVRGTAGGAGEGHSRRAR